MGDSLKIIPLGGCGEIGMNMTLLEIKGRYFFIDAGALFPDQSMIGVNLILPDTSFLEKNEITPEAWLITHGHEDHIGALPYLYKKFPAPIYGTEFTIELIKAKFEDAQIRGAVFNVWKVFQCYNFKDLKVTTFPVNHSIADATGFFLETNYGNILHMGDYRIDRNPPEKSMTHDNIAKVVRRKKIHLMLSDSTNSFQQGTDNSEGEVSTALIDVMKNASGKIIIATFSSNIWRLKSVFEAAQQTKRKIAVFGRSMVRNLEIADRLGLVDITQVPLIGIEEVNKYPAKEVCILCTGSQGENFSGLHRLTWNTLNGTQLKEGDTVVFSSRMIPGNEQQIERIITQLDRMNCTVITSKENKQIHVSGHGYQADLLRCIEVANPECFIPVHGTYRHLKKHRELALSTGMAPEKSLVMENGDVVELEKGNIKIAQKIPSGRDYVIAGGVVSQNSNTYKTRVSLGENGIVCVSLVFDAHTRALVCEPALSIKGVLIDKRQLGDKIPSLVGHAIRQSAKRRNNNNGNSLQDDIRLAIRRYIENVLHYKCNVVVLVHSVS